MIHSVRTNIRYWEKKLFSKFIEERYPNFYIGSYVNPDVHVHQEFICYGYSDTFEEEMTNLTASLLIYGTLDKEYSIWKSKQTYHQSTVT